MTDPIETVRNADGSVDRYYKVEPYTSAGGTKWGWNIVERELPRGRWYMEILARACCEAWPPVRLWEWLFGKLDRP